MAKESRITTKRQSHEGLILRVFVVNLLTCLPSAVSAAASPPDRQHTGAALAPSRSVCHDSTNALPPPHQIEPLVDAIERQHVRDQVVDVDPPLHVPIDDPRHIGPP